VGELVGKARQGVNLENGIRKIDTRKQRVYLVFQPQQAGRLIQFVQWSKSESIFAVDLRDPQVLNAREHCRSATVGFVELLCEGFNLSLG
jgi:hypothetical protein